MQLNKLLGSLNVDFAARNTKKTRHQQEESPIIIDWDERNYYPIYFKGNLEKDTFIRNNIK